MTVEMCVDFCISKGFSIAGLEFSNECYCDNTLPADRAPIPGVMGNCNKPCAGDVTETCGGGSRMSLYQKCPGSGPCKNLVTGVVGNTTATAPSTSSQTLSGYQPTATVASQPGVSTRTTTSSSLTTQQGSSVLVTQQTSRTSIATAASTSPSSSVPLPGGWKPLGCYVDPINPRALDTWAFYGEPVTSSGCAKECNGRGYKFAGTENSGQCFCGNALQGAAVADNADCDMPCDGDANEICGGSARLSVFTNGQPAARIAHSRRHQAHHI
jgi:WSC domain